MKNFLIIKDFNLNLYSSDTISLFNNEIKKLLSNHYADRVLNSLFINMRVSYRYQKVVEIYRSEDLYFFFQNKLQFSKIKKIFLDLDFKIKVKKFNSRYQHAIILLDENSYLCNNCKGYGCSYCKYTGAMNWIDKIKLGI